MATSLEDCTILSCWAELPQKSVDGIKQFYHNLVQENQIQNLTRLTSPSDFIDGHLIDVKALNDSGLLPMSCSAIDLGPGGGVPGLLSGVVDDRKWTLVDSEGRKVEYLNRSAEKLSISDRVKAIAARIEHHVRSANEKIIVSRAVGPVERLYNWLRSGQSWETLILLKGKSWEDEWKKFRKSRFGHELEIEAHYEYFVGEEKKRRVVVKLRRIKLQDRKSKRKSHDQGDTSRDSRKSRRMSNKSEFHPPL